MTEFFVLVVVALIFVVIRLYLRLSDTDTRLGELHNRLQTLEAELRRERASQPTTPAEVRPPHPETPLSKAPVRAEKPEPRATVIPPPLPVTAKTATPEPPVLPLPETAPPLPPIHPIPEAAREKPLLPEINFEAFMGVKLFAWLGGLALFLGVVFFIRYSFEHNLVTPAMRIALGSLTGLALIAGGWFMPRPKYAVTAQTLCATGIVILYGVTYSAHALYHFVGVLLAFGIMAAITAGAFLLAIKLEAQVIAILGLLAGFATPIVLSTGEDNPVGLFSYVAVLDVGLVAVALHQRWRHLITLAAAATVLMQMAWAAEYFQPEKVGIATIVFLGFELLFLLPFWRCNSEETFEKWTAGAAGFTAVSALAFAASLLGWSTLGAKPWIVLSILMLADAGLVAWPIRRTALQFVPILGGGFVFFTLGAWNTWYLTDQALGWALGFFLLFAAFHTALPILLRRLRPAATTDRWAQVFPALGLVLMLWPAMHSGSTTELWAAVLIVDLAAIALAAYTASLLGVVAALLLTLAAAGLWLADISIEAPDITGLLIVIAGFAALFCAASVFLQRRLAGSGLATSTGKHEKEALQHLPAISSILPFLLLVAVVNRLHPVNPTAVFSVGLLLIVILLALTRWSDTLALPPIALGCGIFLEYAWHAQSTSQFGALSTAWYLGFAAIIAAFPFLFQSRTSPRVTPWATAALAPILHYPIFRESAAATWPAFGHTAPGLIPAAFALPALAACEYLRRFFPTDNKARLGVLAWFGGTALFFITLIFPAQFDHEWLTISWALEGAALCWLFHRLPHPGLRLVGSVLLTVAVIRLAAIPNVIGYHARSGLPIWNWYLYTYGISAAACFAGGYFLKPPRHMLGGFNACGTLFSFGTMLLFLLLNIEIADFFSTGPTLNFDFSGNLARDMTYSIAWALFALGMLLVGMHRQIPAVRYASIGLFVVTLVKLFVHDLASLDQLYRIGAFIAVAILLIGASYLYQRFLAAEEDTAVSDQTPKVKDPASNVPPTEN